MNVEFAKKNLLYSLSVAGKVVDTKSVLPSLSCVLFDAIQGHYFCYIQATDLNVFISRREAPINTFMKGSVLIPYKPLCTMVKKLSGKEIAINYENGVCTVNGLIIEGCTNGHDFPRRPWEEKIIAPVVEETHESEVTPAPIGESEPVVEETHESEVTPEPMPEPVTYVSVPVNSGIATETKTTGGFTMTHTEFVLKAIHALRKNGYKGIHTVYSGFNAAFKKKYPNDNPIEVTNKLAEEGTIILTPAKGGVMIYLPNEAPIRKTKGIDALRKMGINI